MSEKTIARWNAIPLNRDEGQPAPITLKRRREDEDDDDDDTSLVSRSPSPTANDSMDVDEDHIHKYDDYVRGPVREVVTVETKIKPTNKGFAMLAKLGWVEGQPIGLSSDGLTEPIPFHVKSDSTGLGKINQDVRMIETTVSQRRGLDSERQQKENEEQRRLRQDNVARKNALNTEISSTLRAFYCSLCDKQFKTVAQYDEHTNSYAHHHKARFRDMQANVRIKAKEDVDKQKEKERKREEKELRKIAAANGIKMAKTPSSTLAAVPVPDLGSLATAPGMGVDMSMDIDGGKPAESKTSGGWASPSTSQGSVHSQGGFKKSGWATVGPSSSSNSAIGRQPPSAHAPTSSNSITGHQNPTFRNAGWSSLDTGSSQPIPVTNQTSTTSSSSHGGGGWSRSLPSSRDGSGFGERWQGSTEPTGQTLPPSEPAAQQSLPPMPPVPPTIPKTTQVPETKPSRSNWQQFQKGTGRRK